MITIHDVAKRAGVSSMTVSRVINRNVNVREPLQRKVMEAIEALGYQMNMAARTTRAGMSRAKIGILYSNPSASFLNEVLLGSLEETSKLGNQLILEKCTGLQSQKQALKRLLEQGVEGIILPPPLCDAEVTIDLLRKAGIPVVALATADPLHDVSAVRINDLEGAISMTNYLLGLGHKRIAFIKGDPQHTPTAKRYAGFEAAMAQAGIPIDPRYVARGNYTYQSGLEAAEGLLSLEFRPTAIFASNDDMAAAVISVAAGLGMRVPDDLSVCGFDDTSIATTVWPQITTVHQPIVAMGRASVAMAFEQVRRVKSGQPPVVSDNIVKFSLKERGSTGPAPELHIFRHAGDGGVLPR